MKILSIRTLSILAGFILSPAFAFATFSDVPSVHPNYEAINYIQAQNIAEGYSDRTFRPDNLINRAEFTKIIIEANYQEQANGNNCFPDVGLEWFAKYVCFAKFSNFIAGYPDGNFKPADNINFAEAAKILVNVKELTITPDPIAWYKPYTEKLAEINAIPTSIKSFNQKLTRGEMAEMVYRLKVDVTSKPSKTNEELIQEQESPGLPVRIQIPGIHVDADVEYVGLTPEGVVDIPKDPYNAAWYNIGPRPGDIGSSVITGHINWYGGISAVFANLDKLKPGDKITVRDDKGAIIPFVIRESRIYDAEADAIEVFSSNDGKAHLNLITCEGVWIPNANQYSERLVIFADKETEQ